MEAAIEIDDATLITSSACAAADALGLKRRQFAQIIGVSEPSISRYKNGQSQLPEGKPFEFALLLIRIYRALFAIVGGDKIAMQHWMKTPNRHLQGQVPTELIQRIDGIIQTNRYLDAMRGRV